MSNKGPSLIERFVQWIAWHLPKRIVFWAAIRLMANATQGVYSNTEVDSLTITQALDRWEY